MGSRRTGWNGDLLAIGQRSQDATELLGFAEHRVGILDAFHQSIVGTEQWSFLPLGWPFHAQHGFESRSFRRVTQTKIAVADDEETAGLEAALKIHHRCGKVLESDKVIATGDTGLSQTAVA